MNKKYAIFAFKGETMCFVHALLNALDMKKQGHDVKLIVEGTATRLIKELSDPKKPFANLYEKTKREGLIEGVCKACAAKTLISRKRQGAGVLTPRWYVRTSGILLLPERGV